MGLSGRKVKQRIGADPRNLTWADDAAKFGQSYLSKFGWDPSKGLGANGDGRTSHIKVAQKLNLMGIGAGSQQAGPEGVAWKQNREYELLLQRLNENSEPPVAQHDAESESGEQPCAEADVEGSRTEHKEKKRKKDRTDGREEKSRKKKRTKHDEGTGGNESAASKPEKKKKAKRLPADGTTDHAEHETPPSEPSTPPTPVFAPRPMAHRARFLASKRLAAMSSTAVSEILGISPSASASPFSTPIDTPTPVSTPSLTVVPSMEQLSTSKKSVADYFKDKLSARKGVSTQVSEDTNVPNEDRDHLDSPRFGLGAKSMSHFHQSHSATNDADCEAPRAGLGMKRGSDTFLPAGNLTPYKGLTQSEMPEEGSGNNTMKSRGEDGKRVKTTKKEKKMATVQHDDISSSIRDNPGSAADDNSLTNNRDVRQKKKKSRREREQTT